MAKLLKVRGTRHDRNDQFESLLLLSLRGPVVFEGLWNDQIQFSESQWKELVENHWDEDQRSEGVMMRAMAKMPLYILRGRKVLKGESVDPTLAQEISIIYHHLIESQRALSQRLDNLEKRIQCAGPEIRMLTEIRDAATRIYSFQLSVVIIAGCVLGVLSEFTPELQAMLNWCATEIYSYVPFCQKWRPLGSSYMLLSLSMAWTGTDDKELKQKLQDAYIDQHRDFPANHEEATIVESLEAGARKFLRLGVEVPVRQNSEGELEGVKHINIATSPGREKIAT